jgi:flagellar biosynthesis protein FlhA
LAKSTTATLLGRAIPFLKYVKGMKQLTIVFVLIAILAIIIVPLPSFVLDFFLTISLAIATLVILMSVFIAKPTDFTTFPTLILIITLYRLSLNIATTRMILTEGHNGPEAVSDIIASFGSFVVGGNYVIGIIVFIILVLINFMVVTNGSTRVAEVGARFTLDSMPGKQMAVDADLNAGLIDDAEAKKRRQEILTEANFYGAMDGSSKFVKGDAIAGIIITLVNIIGGILIGVFQHDMNVSDSASAFTILTIGDGLVGQIPALLMATATGIVITRASKEDENFASGVITQLSNDYKILLIVGAIMMLFASVPGLPTLSLGFVGFAFLGAGLLIKTSSDGSLDRVFKKYFGEIKPPPPKKGAKKNATPAAKGQQNQNEESKQPEKSPAEMKEDEERALEEILKVELLELDLGYQLIRLADVNQGGDLLERVRTMRRKVASEYGFLMPQVRIRDNLQLQPNQYEIKLKGISIGFGDIYPNKFLAMSSGLVIETVSGIETKEPAFGLDAVWVDQEKKEDAILKGYTVVDPSTVMTTHLSEMVKKHSEELITRQDVQKLLDSLKKDYPVVVDDALKVASVGIIQRVIKLLLHEKIPIRDMLTIMETIADIAEITQVIDILVEQVRAKLARTITSLYVDQNNLIRLITLDQATEQKLLGKIQDQNGVRTLNLNVTEINALVQESSEAVKQVLSRGIAPAILIVDPVLRKALSEIFERFALEVVVLSHSEIDASAKFEVLGSIDIPQI